MTQETVNLWPLTRQLVTAWAPAVAACRNPERQWMTYYAPGFFALYAVEKETSDS